MISRRDFLKVLGALTVAPLSGALLPVSAQRLTARDSHPNVIVLVFDTLSAQHASLYGYPRRTTPNLERFAAFSTVYHQHWAAGNFTMPGTASLLTGVYPWQHRGLHLFNARIAPAYATENLFSLPGGAPADWLTYTHNPIVVDLLQQMRLPVRQFQQAVETFLGNDLMSYRLFRGDMQTAFWAERMVTNLDYAGAPTALFLATLQKAYHTLVTERQLARYRQMYPRGLPTNDNGLYFRLEDAVDWLTVQLRANPPAKQVYFHVLPPHEPYTPRAEFVGLFDDDGFAPPSKPASPFGAGFTQTTLNNLRREYDEYLAYADAEFGRLLDALEASGQLEDSIVIFTSDHGQMFERGILGHITPVLYEPLLHIPLLIHLPGQRTRQDIHAPTSAVDVLPTLARLFNLPLPDWVEGLPLPLSEAESQRASDERPVFALDAKENAKNAPLTTATFAVRRGDYKLIHYLGYPGFDDRVELYDLRTDPEERVDLSAQRPEVVQALLALLARYQRPPYIPSES